MYFHFAKQQNSTEITLSSLQYPITEKLTLYMLNFSEGT